MKAPERAFSLLKVLHYMCLNGCLVLCLKRYFLVQVDTFKKEEALYLDTVKPQLSPAIILMSGVAHDGGILQS